MIEDVGRVRNLRRLSLWQWQVLLTAPLVLLVTAVRLRTRGYRATLAAARTGRGAVPSAVEDLALARETAYALAVAVRYGPWRPRCLLRSLALGWFLDRRGVPFDLRIGVPAGMTAAPSEADPGLRAHAWVEVGGTVVNDRDDVAGAYNPFAHL